MEKYKGYYADYFKKILWSSDKNNKNISIIQNNNTSNLDSILISSPATPWRDKKNNILFAKIREDGRRPFIGFKIKFKEWFDKNGIETYSIKSDSGYLRIALSDFDKIEEDNVLFKDFALLVNEMFIDAMCFPSFGCCSRYQECAELKKCVHQDQVYATACMYRKNLEKTHLTSKI